ncbi:hypothetical protein F4778DRAFT_797762 [Xylariomycetidae sp. FL2044]|nr:hypothetical protein F4778DRAFT_797762 [Xylariomycetidae sp. FL2044]
MGHLLRRFLGVTTDPWNNIRSCPGTQTIELGDTCDSLSEGNDISVAKLLDMNPDLRGLCDNPPPGMILCLPEESSSPRPSLPKRSLPASNGTKGMPTPPCTSSYTVRHGDTCERIAVYEEIKLVQLIAMNPSLKMESDGSCFIEEDQELCVGIAGDGGHSSSEAGDGTQGGSVSQRLTLSSADQGRATAHPAPTETMQAKTSHSAFTHQSTISVPPDTAHNAPSSTTSSIQENSSYSGSVSSAPDFRSTTQPNHKPASEKAQQTVLTPSKPSPTSIISATDSRSRNNSNSNALTASPSPTKGKHPFVSSATESSTLVRSQIPFSNLPGDDAQATAGAVNNADMPIHRPSDSLGAHDGDDEGVRPTPTGLHVEPLDKPTTSSSLTGI